MMRPLPLVLLLSALALAGEVDPTTLYALKLDGSTKSLKVGHTGKFVLTIQAQEGAHVSPDAPLKLQLTGDHVAVGKATLTHADAVNLKGPDAPTSPRFEVPFTAQQAGRGEVAAKLTFFICTEQLCSRQQRQVKLPVDVR